jgi:hypothetical protein
MGPAMFDPSAWGNGDPGAWRRGIALQPGFLPPCLLSSQNLVTFPKVIISFSGAIEGKGEYHEGAVG